LPSWSLGSSRSCDDDDVPAVLNSSKVLSRLLVRLWRGDDELRKFNDGGPDPGDVEWTLLALLAAM